MIPKILMQKTREPLPEYVDLIWNKKLEGWEHIVISGEIEPLKWLEENPSDEFPDIIKIYNKLSNKSHKADLIRFYFLYLNGGIICDDDIMIYCDINEIKESFITINENGVNGKGEELGPVCLVGFMGITPKHDLIKEILEFMRNIDLLKLMTNYHYITKSVYEIAIKYNLNTYYEKEILEKVAHTYDKNGNLIMSHYFKDKIIPELPELN